MREVVFSYIKKSLFLLSLSCLAAAQVSVLTQRYDSARDGLNASETTLTPSNVNTSTFGKLFSLPVDGRVFAQPLYVPNLSIPGNGTHNVVFIATEHDSVYAYDADGLQTQPLWMINLATSSCPTGWTCTSVPASVGAPDTYPEVGITSTPVIDPSTDTVFVVAKTQEISGSTTNYVYRLHALNITTGTESSSPVLIQGQVPGSGSPNSNGSLVFSPMWSMQRPGLVLVNDVVYIAFGSWGDDSVWHGWVFGYNESSLAQTAVFSVTPNGTEGEGGIWMHGNGIAADASGYLYFSTGNGGFDGITNYSDSFLKLSTPGLTVADYFTPFNQAYLDAGDLDIASGGLTLLPDSAGTTQYPHIMIGCGKNGAIYVIDRDDMGEFNSSGDSQIIQEVLNVIGGTQVSDDSSTYVNNCFSSPAYWQGHVYWGGGNDSIKMFNFTNGLMSTSLASQSSEVYQFPGASPIVSANGSAAGIVWTIENSGILASDKSGTASILHAYDATNLAHELYNSNQVASDSAGAPVKFTVPVVVNGKVYVETQSAVAVYGLFSPNPPGVPTNLVASGGNGQVGLSWSGSSGATSYNVGRSTASGGPYTTIASPTGTSYTDTGVTNGTTYYYVVAAVNTAGASANSSQVSATPQLAVPGVPTNLVASGGNGQVGLSWSGSSGATSYNVGRSTTSGGPYTTIASPTGTSYTDTGVTNGTTYYYVVAAVNTAGASANSSQVSATPASSATVINYGSGFSSSGLQLNGSTTLNGTRLRLTNGGGGEAASAFYTTAVNVQSFTTNFSFQMTSAAADGMAFVIQNGAATALGSGGGGLGYQGIANSVAVKFDIYSNAGEGTDSTGMYTDGAVPTVPAVDMTSSGVSLLSGDVMNVQLSYNGTTLTMTITDASTLKSFTTSWTVNIPTTVGGDTALVGFTGGTGGLTAIQDVISWTYSTGSSTNPPAVPTNLVASGGNGQVGLSWSGSSGATSYNVGRSTASGGPYTTIASPTGTSYTDTGVTNGTTYYYVVAAVNTAGASANSSQVSATPQLAVPGVPTNLVASGGNGQVGLSWSGSSGATSYNVGRSTTSGGPYTTIASPTGTSYTDTGVTNGTTYYYVVAAVNTAGASANSSQVSATPQLAVPGVPTNLVASGGNGQVGLSWSGSSGATSYNVGRSTTSGGPYTTIASPTGTSYTDTGVTNGTTYYYVVAAVNTAGASANSSQVSATPASSATVINYGSGFSSSGLQLNGSTTLNGTRLRLTNGGGGEAASAFYTTAVNVQSFTTNFSFQMTSAAADGMAFVIQNGAATALGSGGGGLGYQGIANSVAVKFDIYSNAGEGTDSTGMYTDGAVPTVPAVDMTSSGVSLLSGDVMNVQLSYNGTTLTMTITDASTLKSFTTSWTVNIPTTVGGDTALVGFTGGTGGLTAIQDVISWTYSTGSSTNPPAVPTNLVASGGNGQVGLSWSGSSGATSYNVGRSTASGGPYTTIASPTGTSYTDTGVTNGTTYYYVVAAVNTAGASANSSQVSATPQLAVPGVPTNLVASGGNGQVGLSWSGSSGATSYNVGRSTTSGGPYTTIASPTGTSYTDTGVTNGTTYYYVVAAVNTAGASANSSQVSATPQLAVPGVPTNLVASGGNGQVGLSWSGSSGATSYNVGRSTTSGGPYTTIASPTGTSYTDTGVTNGTTYYYVVAAVNTAGASANSSQVSATPASSATVINYGSGFSSSGLQLNGSTTLNGTRLRLTNGGGGEAASAFYTTAVNVQSFTTNFSFQMTSAAADGMAFVIQNGAATALGSGGGGLGYQGIANSVAVKFDIYSNAGEGTDSTGMYTDGAVPTVPAVDMTSSGVSLLSGDVMNVQLSYNGTTLTMTITDASTLKSFTTSWTVNIPTTVGGDTALVGFTGGTGGLTAIQDVISWTMTNQ